MLTGTRRSIVEILLEGEAAPTDVAEELDVSVQTVHRHLTSLEEEGYVRESGTRSGKTRPYKLYSVEESASVFAIYDGRMSDLSFAPTEAHETLLSILRVPQPEFHSVLVAHLFGLPVEWNDREIHSIAVYGPVARGEATDESDVDVLFVVEEGEATTNSLVVDNAIEEFDDQTTVSQEVATTEELRKGIELDSQFLRGVFEEMILLYDPDDFLEEQRRSYLEDAVTAQSP